MKLGDRYRVDALAKQRGQLLDAVEILSRPIKEGGNSFGITIRSTYQDDEILEACRPRVLQVFRAKLLSVEEDLSRLGVEIDE